MDPHLTPLISIVIPVFNRPRELTRALDSISCQDVRNFEVIVCDDGSTDDIESVVKKYIAFFPVRYFRIKNSGGPARPRNIGISVAHGEWISFLDSDDWWSPVRMRSVESHLSPEVDLIYHSLNVQHDSKLERIRERRSTIGEPMLRDPLTHMLFFGNPIPNSSVVVRRKLLQSCGGISEDPSLIEDFHAWLRLAAEGAHFRFIGTVLGTYWVGSDGISSLNRRQIERYQATVLPFIHRLNRRDREYARCSQHFYVGSMCARLNDEDDLALEHLRAARRLPSLTMTIKRQALLLWVAGIKKCAARHRPEAHGE